MAKILSIPGIQALRERTLGDARVCIAILDGPVDLTHPCFEKADVRRLDPHWTGDPQPIPETVEHATHITSLVLGQPGSGVEGIAPRCRAINVPVIYDSPSMLDPIALTHAVNIAFREGANIIHVASCIPTRSGSADDLVARAVRTCLENNVLVVAPAGNDKGECFCVPAAIPGVLAVGAVDDEGKPTRFSNWGGIYQQQGVVAPGIDIVGAAPGGKTSTHKGTSCAAPIVTGTAALLMSLQLREGWPIDARRVRDAVLGSAVPCDAPGAEERQRCLVGMLDVGGAVRRLFELSSAERQSSSRRSAVRAQVVSVRGSGPQSLPARSFRTVERHEPGRLAGSQLAATVDVPASVPAPCADALAPSAREGRIGGGLVFFIGLVGFDFGTEARRDTFKQQMHPVLASPSTGTLISTEDMSEQDIQAALEHGSMMIPANPFDARQMVVYLRRHPDEARSLIWTLSLELTPVYAVEPCGPFAAGVYAELVNMLDGQSAVKSSASYVERVSIPAILSGESIRLFSGQEVSQLMVDAKRGMYAWRTTELIERAIDAVKKAEEEEAAAEAGEYATAPVLPSVPELRKLLRQVLNKIYYQYRNLGISSPDRALNFAASNVFQLATVIARAALERKSLDQIDVVKSPYCRVDSDCWDVMLKFQDPEHTSRAFTVWRFALDVSDRLPVTLGPLVDYTSTS